MNLARDLACVDFPSVKGVEEGAKGQVKEWEKVARLLSLLFSLVPHLDMFIFLNQRPIPKQRRQI